MVEFLTTVPWLCAPRHWASLACLRFAGHRESRAATYGKAHHSNLPWRNRNHDVPCTLQACSATHNVVLASTGQMWSWGHNLYACCGLRESGASVADSVIVAEPVELRRCFGPDAAAGARGMPRAIACGKYVTYVSCHPVPRQARDGGDMGTARLGHVDAAGDLSQIQAYEASSQLAEARKADAVAAATARGAAGASACDLCDGCRGFRASLFAPTVCAGCMHLQTRHRK